MVTENEFETLRLLRDYFPTAVFTGTSLVFIDEDRRVKLTKIKKQDFSRSGPHPCMIHASMSKRTLGPEAAPEKHRDFQAPSLAELAEEIEKFRYEGME